MPIKDERTKENAYRHFQIQNNEARLINTFASVHYLDEYGEKNKLLMVGNKLYNFETGTIICECFDEIFSVVDDMDYFTEKFQVKRYRYSSKKIEESKAVAAVLSAKMKEEDLLIGYKKIKIEKDGISLKYKIFAFINKKGDIVSSLYYMEDYDFMSIDDVNRSNFEEKIEELKIKLLEKFNEKILREEKKKNVLSQMKKKLSL